MLFLNNLKQLADPYHFINISLSLSYLITKKLPYLCGYTFSNSDKKCELDLDDLTSLLFLLIMTLIIARKRGSSAFIYPVSGNMILWFKEDLRLGLFFLIVFVLSRLFFPPYSGRKNITYFRHLQALENVLERDKNTTWLVAFISLWNPAYKNFAPIFDKLSVEYHCDYLRFGEIDIERSSDAGAKYNVSDSSASQQLPFLILFQNGQEINRWPKANSGSRLQEFFFSEDTIQVAFNLKDLYQKINESKENRNANEDKVPQKN